MSRDIKSYTQTGRMGRLGSKANDEGPPELDLKESSSMFRATTKRKVPKNQAIDDQKRTGRPTAVMDPQLSCFAAEASRSPRAEIVEEIARLQFFRSASRTPANSLYSLLWREDRRHV